MIFLSLWLGRDMEKEMAGKIGTSCFDAVEDDEILTLSTKIKKLPRYFAGLLSL